MIGIYKITNKINGMIYIGESVQIERRFTEHKMPSNNSTPIDKDIKIFGKDNFSYEIIEECPMEKLIEREHYWIEYYNCYEPYGYNKAKNSQLITTVYQIPKEIVDDIRENLINSNLSITEISKKYNVSISTVSKINNGIIYVQQDLIYPLRQTQPKKQNTCECCGKAISYYAKKCKICAGLAKRIDLPISRDDLKTLIRTTSFEEIGRQFKVSGNAIKKWCDKYNLPRTKKEIKQYSNNDWDIL